MQPTWLDQSIERRLTMPGYAIVPFLGAAHITRLMKAYEEMADESLSGFHATMYSRNADRRREVFELLRPLVAEQVRRVAKGYRVCVANWLVKEPTGANTVVGFHQDWTFVAESEGRSINIWFPLMDVDERFGCLEVVGGSHLMSTDHRAHSDPCRFGELAPILRERYTRAVPMQAGQAIFYDGALLHSSRTNESRRRRVAVGAVLVPEEAQIVHCFRRSPTSVEVFAVDESFFWRHVPGTRPEGVLSLGVVSSSTSLHLEEALAHLVGAG
jgi:hypothetical protein